MGNVAQPAALSSVRSQVSLTAGTVLQDTRKPLRMWFLAMWFVTSQKNGVSALGLGQLRDGMDLAA